MAEPRIMSLAQIEAALDRPGLNDQIERAFVAYSRGQAVVPPVGELLFAEPPGDVHIKYGYIKGGTHYVIKVASSFYDNPKVGLPSSDGLMLVSEVRTGALTAVLLDGGWLTNVRTAIAGALCARVMARKDARAIGVIGTGVQARLQLKYLRDVLPTRNAMVFGRSRRGMDDVCVAAKDWGYDARLAGSVDELAEQCDVIVTTTPAKEPMIFARHLRPGMHVTGVGADTVEKNEVAADAFDRADCVVVDSRLQCRERGDLAHSRRMSEDFAELGEVLAGARKGRTTDDQVTIADLTGVAVQDVAIATFVLNA